MKVYTISYNEDSGYFELKHEGELVAESRRAYVLSSLAFDKGAMQVDHRYDLRIEHLRAQAGQKG